MLPTIKYKKDFDYLMSTGSPVVILKKNNKCDCFDETELINSEPSPYCRKCFGTGYERNLIFTENIRHEIHGMSVSVPLEKVVYNSSINEIRIFFMPSEYSFITTEELIGVLDENNKITSLYKVVNKEKYKVEDFSYLEIYGEKINFVPTLEV